MPKKSPTTQKRCVIYIRRAAGSPDKTPLVEQEKECLDFIQEAEGWIFTGKTYEDDGVSGLTRNREGLNALMADARDGQFDCVVFLSADRISRSHEQYDEILAELQSYGVDAVSAFQSKEDHFLKEAVASLKRIMQKEAGKERARHGH